MKTRLGFVSNSSSSSFVVARTVIGDERFSKFAELLEAYEASKEREEYSDDFYFEFNRNYIHVTSSYHDEGVMEIKEKMKFKSDEYLSTNN